jgi:hypothetical protein
MAAKIVCASVALRSWWTPDAALLSLLTREQVQGVAVVHGATALFPSTAVWTKKPFVEAFTVHFTEHSTTDDPTDQVTRDWVPGLPRFPAEKKIVRPES